MLDHDRAVPEWLVERLVAGDLPVRRAAEVQARLELTGRGARVGELRAANQTTLARYPARTVAAEVERRLNLRAPEEAPSAAKQRDSAADPRGERVMTLWEHLAELRSRLIRTAFAFACGVALSWGYRENLLEWLTMPFVTAWSNGAHAGLAPALHFPSPASLFLAYVRLAGLGGFVFALPFMLYQGWAFVAPGLYAREKNLAAPFVVTSCALFALGGLFGWRFAFPAAFEYLLSFAGPIGGANVQPTIMVSDYIEFVTHMLLAFGFAAELPIVVFFLSYAGLVTHKQLIAFFRYFVVLAFVISAVLTPPDPMSQLMLAVPLCVLYGVSIGVAFVFSRRRA